MKKLYFSLFFAMFMSFSFAQDTIKSESSIDLGVDLYSRYIWRGLTFSDAPNIQPWLSFGWKGLNVMAWGSYATSMDYAEVDLFLSYTWKNLTIGINDYFNPKVAGVKYEFTNWDKTTTVHLVEAYFSYQLPLEKAPLVFTASTFLYGSSDLNDSNENAYSTYLELAYPFSKNEVDVNVFVGATVNGSFYASSPSFVNVGVSMGKSLAITDKFSIPVNGSFIVHPKNKDIFLVFGFSF